MIPVFGQGELVSDIIGEPIKRLFVEVGKVSRQKGARVALDTLGCKLNQAEVELWARQLVAAGYRLVVPSAEADVYVLNTCTVTHTADSKCRHWLRMARRRNPDALLVAAGCYAERAPEELAQVDGVRLVLNNQQKRDLPAMLGQAVSPNYWLSNLQDSDIGCTGGFRTRAMVAVQRGCNDFCSYCVVPLVRGREESLPLDEVVAGVRQRVSDGYKEIILTGTKIGAYDYEGADLKILLARLLAEPGVERLRLSSVQPGEISGELIDLWHDRRLCPHFHFSLQSGSDAVLGRMGRRYTTADYQRAVSLVREAVPDLAITTDVIVGFPGETDKEFQESYDFCRRMEFARMHVFPYSPRPGTLAAGMAQDVAADVKKQRGKLMLALAKASSRNFRQLFIGRIMPVLWEQQSVDGVWSGLTDNYLRVYTRSDGLLTNKLLPVKLVKVRGDGVWGEVTGRI